MALSNSEDSPLSVVQVSKAMGDWIAKLGRVWVEGQLSQINRRPGASMVFMRLRDSSTDTALSLVMNAAAFTQLAPPPTEGAHVVAYASIDFWRNRGQIHLRAHQLRSIGIGELLARLEQLRSTLDAEGVFAPARKRALPFLPRRIGIITGRNADALRDVVTNVRRRWPAAEFEVREVAVQGAGTSAAVTAALVDLDAMAEVDVIVITRGGGSVEDLLPFSDEAMIRAVSKAHTPVVSAIGHERDRPLLDDVADFRASTPTHAAAAIVPDVVAEQARVDSARTTLRAHVRGRMDREQRGLEMLRRSGTLRAALGVVTREGEGVDRLRHDGRRALAEHLTRATAELTGLQHRLHVLSPAATLERGYAIVHNGAGHIVTTPEEVAPGDLFDVRVFHGSFAGQRITREDR